MRGSALASSRPQTATWMAAVLALSLAAACGDSDSPGAGGVTETVEASETYEGQVIEFQTASLDCSILSLPGIDVLADTTFRCGTTGFDNTTYSFAGNGGAGRSVETTISFDSWLTTNGGVYWLDDAQEKLHMAFPLTDPAKDEVVESANILDDSSFEVLTPGGNVSETCTLQT